jgi:hypothetical protein
MELDGAARLPDGARELHLAHLHREHPRLNLLQRRPQFGPPQPVKQRADLGRVRGSSAK